MNWKNLIIYVAFILIGVAIHSMLSKPSVSARESQLEEEYDSLKTYVFHQEALIAALEYEANVLSGMDTVYITIYKTIIKKSDVQEAIIVGDNADITFTQLPFAIDTIKHNP